MTKKKSDDERLILDSGVSVVIPNYNGKHLMKKFLPDVLRVLRDGDELLIVDDCSSDDSISWLIKTFKLCPTKRSYLAEDIPEDYTPDILQLDFKIYTNKVLVRTIGKVGDLDKLANDDGKSDSRKKIRMTSKKSITIVLVSQMTNLRFGATSNVGVFMARHPYIFLLNSDVRPVGNVVNQLLGHFADEKVFGVGCLEYERDKNGEQSGKNRIWFAEGIFKHSKAVNFKTGASAWVSGGSGMFSKKKWMQLKGFDKRFYPAYWEDIDLSFRAKKKGWKILFDADAVVYHVHESTNKDEFGENNLHLMSWKNADKFVLKNGNVWQKLMFYLYQPVWTERRRKYLVD